MAMRIAFEPPLADTDVMTSIRPIIAALAACGTFVLAGCSAPTESALSENSYWYCWDTGAKEPHHLGQPVEGDHVCTDEELEGTGFTPSS
jgi:hypothetical protein